MGLCWLQLCKPHVAAEILPGGFKGLCGSFTREFITPCQDTLNTEVTLFLKLLFR